MATPKRNERIFRWGDLRRTESQVQAIIRIAQAIQPEKKTTIESLGFREVSR
ncbi:MAG TPA: hypothetical protein VMI06_03890 [Terriglobia bacterium]|nr:hypothetical protein [Terriglobia bacterium]